MVYVASSGDIFFGLALGGFSVSGINCTRHCLQIYFAVTIQLAINIVYIWYVKQKPGISVI